MLTCILNFNEVRPKPKTTLPVGPGSYCEESKLMGTETPTKDMGKTDISTFSETVVNRRKTVIKQI